MLTQQETDNAKLLTHNDQHQTDLHQKAVHMQLSEENQRDKKYRKNRNKDIRFT